MHSFKYTGNGGTNKRVQIYGRVEENVVGDRKADISGRNEGYEEETDRKGTEILTGLHIKRVMILDGRRRDKKVEAVGRERSS